MLINMNNDKNIPTDTEACYEELASQEELYLEETEEEVRAILISYVSSASQNDRSTKINICREREFDLDVERPMTEQKSNTRMADHPDEELVDVVEELITGDADDPPLSEETVQEMMNDSPTRRLGSVS